ncbi:S-adenosyl-L-methionine-dependent methyltransferase [Aulographum hederae CBS 113979]|uniref:S-adenosyl-L-methionine-dependent methyltransferase n=1 Tax=Aulographum hederae CBS 113979 TaxID=1176131 RepID=A0A6G1H904_9PEZI|nr:S-adenosyl-L-methionine-dependent methyltransferase [Aulographum hederae CBS 113979]
MQNRDYLDSGIGSPTSSTTTSVTSSNTEFVFEHGRRYHGNRESHYHLPNDEQEMDRLELQHLIWSACFDGQLYLAPLDKVNITEALDIGCGTGAWAIEFADAHPDCHILGTDLSPIQPTSVPVNCEFIIEDAASVWAFPQQFDFIHTRAITMGIKDWPRLLGQAYAALKPGGWIELQEFQLPLGCDDGSVVEGESALARWGEELRTAAGKLGIDTIAIQQHAKMLADLGFEDVKEGELKIPLGPWAKGKKQKKIGIMALKDLAEGLQGISTRLLVMLGTRSEEEVKVFLDEVRDELMRKDVHSYMPIHITWARKPLTAAET